MNTVKLVLTLFLLLLLCFFIGYFSHTFSVLTSTGGFYEKIFIY